MNYLKKIWVPLAFVPLFYNVSVSQNHNSAETDSLQEHQTIESQNNSLNNFIESLKESINPNDLANGELDKLTNEILNYLKESEFEDKISEENTQAEDTTNSADTIIDIEGDFEVSNESDNGLINLLGDLIKFSLPHLLGENQSMNTIEENQDEISIVQEDEPIISDSAQKQEFESLDVIKGSEEETVSLIRDIIIFSLPHLHVDEQIKQESSEAGKTFSLPHLKIDKQELSNIGIYNEVEVDKRPVAKNLDWVRSLIKSPVKSLSSGKSGIVLVELLVGSGGSVIGIGKMFGPRNCYNEVRSKIRKLRFTPAIKNGRPVKCWTTVKFPFKLNPDSLLSSEKNQEKVKPPMKLKLNEKKIKSPVIPKNHEEVKPKVKSKTKKQEKIKSKADLKKKQEEVKPPVKPKKKEESVKPPLKQKTKDKNVIPPVKPKKKEESVKPPKKPKKKEESVKPPLKQKTKDKNDKPPVKPNKRKKK